MPNETLPHRDTERNTRIITDDDPPAIAEAFHQLDVAFQAVNKIRFDFDRVEWLEEARIRGAQASIRWAARSVADLRDLWRRQQES